MDNQQLSERLKQARKQAGMTQEDVAKRLGLPRSALSQIEQGNRNISTLELSKMAKLYHKDIASFFEESFIPAEQTENISLALYRMGGDFADNPAAQEQIKHYVDLSRTGFELERLLGFGRGTYPPHYGGYTPECLGAAIEQAESIADQERQRLGLGITPVPDMADLINEQHIWASGAQLPESVSGVFLYDPISFGMTILVNRTHSRARKRFSYAHEYAHALFDRGSFASVSSKDNAPSMIEKRANAFAASFLLPKQGVFQFLRSLNKGRPSRDERTIYDVATQDAIHTSVRPAAFSQTITYQDVALLAQHFGTSFEATTYRLKSLSILSSEKATQLLKQIEVGRDYLRALDMFDDLEKPEDTKRADRELRSHILHLVIEAYRREEISRGRLLDVGELLGIEADRIMGLAEAARTN